MTDAIEPIEKPRDKARLFVGRCSASVARRECSCPVDIIATDHAGEPVIASEKCVGCVSGVRVFVEQTEGVPARVSWELLGKGRKLADSLETDLTAVLLGENMEALCYESFACGADKVILADTTVFRHYRIEACLEALGRLIETDKPEIVLMGATAVDTVPTADWAGERLRSM